MPSRSRSRSASRGRRSNLSRRRSPVTPVGSKRGRSTTRTTSANRSVSMARTRSSSMGSRAMSLASRAGSVVARRIPYVGPALAARDMYNEVFGLEEERLQAEGRISTSKAAGFFGGGKNNYSVFDKHIKTGVVTKTEKGFRREESVNNIIYLGHSSMPRSLLIYAALSAIVKKMLLLQDLDCKSFLSFPFKDQYFPFWFLIEYKVRDGTAIVQKYFPSGLTGYPAATTTLNIIANDMNVWLQGLVGDAMPDQFLQLKLFDDTATLTAGSKVLRTAINLSKTNLTFDAKSVLKVQNRTINSTGNDTSEDVDNVPLHGKYFEFKTNGSVFQDYSDQVGPSQIVTDAKWGDLPTSVIVGNTTLYQDIPEQSQFAGCKKSSKIMIDPGEIRTSVLKDHLQIPFSKMVKLLIGKLPASGTANTQYWVGKTRLLAFEKMIQTAALGAVDKYQLAYEIQTNIGCTAAFTKDTQTAPQFELLGYV